MLFLPPPALPLAAGRQRTDNTVTKRPATGAATIERCCKTAQVNRSRYLIEAGYSPAKRLMIISAHTAHLRIVRAIGDANPGKARHAMVRHLEDFGEQLENSGRIDDVIVPRSARLRRAQIPRP